MTTSLTPAPRFVYHALLALLLLVAPLVGWAKPRPNYQLATQVVSTDAGCLTVVCGSVNRPALAVDTDTVTAAEVTSPPTVTAAALRVRFANMVFAGYQAGLALSSVSGLNVSLLENIRVRTYLGSSRTPQQDLSVASLLTVASLNDQVTVVSFPVTATFDQIEVSAGGLVAASYTVRLHYAESFNAAAPLPVTLTAFAAQQRGSAVQVTWKTASEQNADYFAVERSSSPAAGFSAVGRVAASGTSSAARSYQYQDPLPKTDAAGRESWYYRLRQVDHDGQTTYSQVVVVVRGLANEFSVYPNPAAAGATLHMLGAALPGHRVQVFTAQGRCLHDAPAESTRPVLRTPGLYVLTLLNEKGEAVARQRLLIE